MKPDVICIWVFREESVDLIQIHSVTFVPLVTNGATPQIKFPLTKSLWPISTQKYLASKITREFARHWKASKVCLNRIKNALKLAGWRLLLRINTLFLPCVFFWRGWFRALRAESANSRSSTPEAQIEAASCGNRLNAALASALAQIDRLWNTRCCNSSHQFLNVVKSSHSRSEQRSTDSKWSADLDRCCEVARDI